MMGGSGAGGGSPLSGRTMVGIRGLTTITPAKTGKTEKKKGAEENRRLDKVVRDEERDGLFVAMLNQRNVCLVVQDDGEHVLRLHRRRKAFGVSKRRGCLLHATTLREHDP